MWLHEPSGVSTHCTQDVQATGVQLKPQASQAVSWGGGLSARTPSPLLHFKLVVVHTNFCFLT